MCLFYELDSLKARLNLDFDVGILKNISVLKIEGIERKILNDGKSRSVIEVTEIELHHLYEGWPDTYDKFFTVSLLR